MVSPSDSAGGLARGFICSYAPEGEPAAQNSPVQMISAGPVSVTPAFSQRIWRFPANVFTVTGLSTILFRIAATLAPHEPVPDDNVKPTPRSQKRTSISWRETGL